MGKAKYLLIFCLIFQTSLYSQYWFNVYNNPNFHFWDFCVVGANTVYAVGYTSPSPFTTVLIKTTNGGLNWEIRAWWENLSTGYTYVSAKCIDTVYFTGQLMSSGAPLLFKSIDGGMNWTYLVPVTYGQLGFYFLNNNTGFIKRVMGVAKTTNGGVNWSTFYLDGQTTYGIHFLNLNTGYRCTGNGFINKTTNGGDSWFILSNLQVTTKSVFFTDTLNGYTTGDSSGGHPNYNYLAINKTTDGGATWNQQVFNYTQGGKVIQFTDEMTGYVCANTRILKTTNSGVVWENNFISSAEGILDMEFANNTTGYILCEYGIIRKTTTGGVSAIKEYQNTDLPTVYYLYQNYPNPFNPTTVIEFQIPKKSFTTLKVFNSLGNEVCTLNDNVLNSGKYKFEFNGKNLSSGIYFYQLIAEDFKETRKMILIK